MGGLGQVVENQALNRGADRVVVGERSSELLLVVGVPNAEREIELVGDVEDIVREQRPILAILAIDIVDAAAVAQAIEGGECSHDVGARCSRCTNDRSRPRHAGRREGGEA